MRHSFRQSQTCQSPSEPAGLKITLQTPASKQRIRLAFCRTRAVGVSSVKGEIKWVYKKGSGDLSGSELCCWTVMKRRLERHLYADIFIAAFVCNFQPGAFLTCWILLFFHSLRIFFLNLSPALLQIQSLFTSCYTTVRTFHYLH